LTDLVTSEFAHLYHQHGNWGQVLAGCCPKEIFADNPNWPVQYE
jgi:hypothetical protein